MELERFRLRIEQQEEALLSPLAAHSAASRGRRRPEPQDPMRTAFQRDRDRILHSNAFRRLKQKTQVFLSPEGDHYRTRLTHTLEVSQIARTIARALALNEDLTEAIALGHDLGHTPFGHAGERALNALSAPGHFHHYEQSLRVVDFLEKDGIGLNLSWEVRDGILNHTAGPWASTFEGQVVRHADHIAFLNHDIEDAVRAGVLDVRELPPEAVAILGDTKSRRITTLIQDLVLQGLEPGRSLAFTPRVEEGYQLLRKFMYSTVYVDPVAKAEEAKVSRLIPELYREFVRRLEAAGPETPSGLPAFYEGIARAEGAPRAAMDYISGMSDEFATRMFERLFIPQKWQVLG